MSKINKDLVAEIYDRNFIRLYKFFYYRCQSKELAEDLTSDVFLAFVRSIKNDHTIENYDTFLYGIAKNTFLKHLRSKYKNPILNIDVEDFVGFVDDFLESVEEPKSLEDVAEPYISLLKDPYKGILVMRFFERLSLSEICSKLNKDMNYVKTTQKRALKKLKDLVELKDIST